MQPFKFVNTGAGATHLINGVAFSKYTSFMWVERYLGNGEFEIVAPLSSGLQTVLPINTIISHVDTFEVCVVENHQVINKKGAEAELKITGRSLIEVMLENRIVAAGYASTFTMPPSLDYTLAADLVGPQIVTLMTGHIGLGAVVNDRLTDCISETLALPAGGPNEARVIKRQNVWKAATELLTINDFGIRTVRRDTNFNGGPISDTYFYVHNGNDKSATVIFSDTGGDIVEAEYLWSSKSSKNVAYVKGRFTDLMVYEAGPPTGFDRRMMLIDAGDIDEQIDPTNVPAVSAALTKMNVRGKQALENQNMLSIGRVELAPNSRWEYRKDYDIGDIVSIGGAYGATGKKRIVEHVEIEERNGITRHPTVAEIPPNAIL